MIIGIDIRALDESNLRGIGKYLFFLLRYLSQIDQESQYLLFCDKRSNSVRELSLPRNFQRVAIGMRGERLHLWEQAALPLNARKRNSDILHYPANTLSLLNIIPSVVTLHDIMMLEYKSKNNIENFYVNFIFKKAIRNANTIITVSEFSKKQIIERLHVQPEKIHVIYHGIDPKFRRVNEKCLIERVLFKYGIKNDYIFCIGGNTERKNVPRLIAAYVNLRKNNLRVLKLVITGVSKNQESILNGTLSAYNKDIVFLPYLSEEELVAFYNGASLTVYPSSNEGFGFPVLEAMACGSPVVTSDRTSLPEVGGNAAFYMDPFSIEDISKKMLEVLDNDSLKRGLIERGFNRIKQFKWENSAAETLAVYERIISRKK